LKKQNKINDGKLFVVLKKIVENLMLID